MSESKIISYRSIFKATSLFGGVQVYQIIIQILKSKIVAVLLGPAGVGIMGLYMSGLQFVQSITCMGLSSSAVRDVSESMGTGDTLKISQTITVVNRLVWATGLLGLLVVLFSAPYLSQSCFGCNDYTIPFIILSITLLIDQLSAGKKVILQGMRRLKDLAKCSAFGVTFGFIISVPLYYCLGVKGIVPTIILNSVCTLFLCWLYSSKVKIAHIDLTPKQTFEQGKLMLIMGLSMSFGGICESGVALLLRSYIQRIGGVDEVGLFQAGFVIMSTYVGMVMNAIGTDFYPRLAAVNKDNEKCREVVSQQGEVGTMILAPMLTLCIIFMPFVLQVLYSNSFLGAQDYIFWACLGMLLRLGAWIIAYQFIAKAESKLFMINEFATNIYYLGFSVLGYKLLGLHGLGAAFALNYLVYFLQCYLIAHHRYQFRFSSSFLRCYAIQAALLVACLATALFTEGILKYFIGILLICLSCYLAFRGLNQRMDLTSVIKSKLHK